MVDWLYNHRHRSLFRQMHPEKAGGLYVEESEQGSVVQEGTGSTYQSVGTFSHVCHLDNYQNVENVSYIYRGRQHDSLELFAENGKDKCRSQRKFGSLYLGRGSRLLPNSYQRISTARQIGHLGTRKIPQNGNCIL